MTSPVRFPAGLRLERLVKTHRRRNFVSGQEQVDEWLSKKALQNQSKRLSSTKVRVDEDGSIAGYYTLATGQADFGDLPAELTRKLPRRILPVAVLAWLGVDRSRQGQGLGRLLLAQALRDCYEAGRTFAFVAVVLDCVDAAAKRFYERFDFAELPGHPWRLYLSVRTLEAMMESR